MNKNINKIIAIAVAMGIVSSVAPATNANILIAKAYASSNSKAYLDSLELSDKDSDNIKLYEDNSYDDKVDAEDVENGNIYYAKTSSHTVSIDIDGPSKSYVKIFKDPSDSTKSKDPGDNITLSEDSTYTNIIINVYGEAPSSNISYGDSDNYEVLSTYKIRVKYTGSDSINSDNASSNESSSDLTASDYDDIYLDRLSVGGSMIELSESIIEYACDVDENVEEATIRATPEDDDYDVTIGGKDTDDMYKATVNLDKGENKFKIEIEHSGKQRIYTLVINRGKTSSTTTSTTTNTTTSTENTESTIKANQWVSVNGKWQYNDATGKSVKNSWVQNYYLQDDGNMATGWLSYSGSWYYLGTDGAIKTGWQSINGNWYYLDSQGKIKTGWFKDTNGKYYYLTAFGAMAYNTTINGYKLGADGAWVK